MKMKAVQYLKRALPIWAPGVTEAGGCRSSGLARIPNKRQTVCRGLWGPGSSEWRCHLCDCDNQLPDNVCKAAGASWQWEDLDLSGAREQERSLSVYSFVSLPFSEDMPRSKIMVMIIIIGNIYWVLCSRYCKHMACLGHFILTATQ